MKVELTEKYEIFGAEGVIIGRLWGGGEGCYPSKLYLGYHTKDGLVEEIKKGVEDGSIDNGFGFQEIEGALMTITKESYLKIENKLYVNKSYEELYFGDLSNKQKEFLSEAYSNFV